MNLNVGLLSDPPRLLTRVWVEGKNNGKLIAHETGFKNLFRYKLAPDGALAMYGQRYPITKIGVRNLLVELLARGKREKEFSDGCRVKFYQDAKVDQRPCRVIEIVNPTKSPRHKFYRARVYIDNQLKIPVRYAAWTWPTKPGGDPVLEEEYTYTRIRLNAGLTDRDFDPDNPAYGYP